MKFLVLNGLSVLLISAATAPALKAGAAVENPTTNNAATTNQLKPFNLVYLAYQGYFRDQGIPSYSALLSAYQAGRITAKDIVQSAVNKNKLSSPALSNQGFLKPVEAYLVRLSKD